MLHFSLPCDAAGVEWSFAGFRRKMFERSEFFSELQNVVKRREPAIAAGYIGQGVRVPFSAYSFVAQQKSMATSGGATP